MATDAMRTAERHEAPPSELAAKRSTLPMPVAALAIGIISVLLWYGIVRLAVLLF